jgi:hypothetical protein
MLLAGLLAIILGSGVDDSAPSSPPVAQTPLNTQIWQDFWHAKINLRYHLNEADLNGCRDRATRAATIILALIALIGPVIPIPDKMSWIKWVWLGFGSVAFLVASIEFVFPFGQWASQDAILASKWNENANEWYALYQSESQQILSKEEVFERMTRLWKDVANIEGNEDASRFSPTRMAQAEKEEMEYQGIKKNAPPGPLKQASGQTKTAQR